MSKFAVAGGEQLRTLVGNRVRLRWLVKDDAPALFDIFGDPQVTRFWGFARLAQLRDAKALVDDIHAHFLAGTLFQWGIEAVDSAAEPPSTGGRIVGTCTLAELDAENRRAALGFALGRAHWGRGYARAAVDTVLAFAFDEMRLHRVVADCDPRNARSIALLERLGFRREGFLREHYFVAGEVQDAVSFGLLRQEWRAGAMSATMPSG